MLPIKKTYVLVFLNDTCKDNKECKSDDPNTECNGLKCVCQDKFIRDGNKCVTLGMTKNMNTA